MALTPTSKIFYYGRESTGVEDSGRVTPTEESFICKNLSNFVPLCNLELCSGKR